MPELEVAAAATICSARNDPSTRGSALVRTPSGAAADAAAAAATEASGAEEDTAAGAAETATAAAECD